MPRVEQALAGNSERSSLVRNLWQAGTSYIHWRMPWIGYEYWDPEQPEDERFLTRGRCSADLIGQAVGAFAKLFGTLPRSACAPGYRANDDTHRAMGATWNSRCAERPGKLIPPHFDRTIFCILPGRLNLSPRSIRRFRSRHVCVRPKRCFERGIPAIVSMHSINFHSTVRDFPLVHCSC